jgi:hypothetical protein
VATAARDCRGRTQERVHGVEQGVEFLHLSVYLRLFERNFILKMSLLIPDGKNNKNNCAKTCVLIFNS